MNNYTYKQIWLINFPVMMSILMEQLINITDAVFLGHVGKSSWGRLHLQGFIIWQYICWDSDSVLDYK